MITDFFNANVDFILEPPKCVILDFFDNPTVRTVDHHEFTCVKKYNGVGSVKMSNEKWANYNSQFEFFYGGKEYVKI